MLPWSARVSKESFPWVSGPDGIGYIPQGWVLWEQRPSALRPERGLGNMLRDPVKPRCLPLPHQDPSRT